LLMSAAAFTPVVAGGQSPTSIVSDDDLEAVGRSIGFIESLPQDGTLVIGTVYPSTSAELRTAALDVARRLGALAGPHGTRFVVVAIPSHELAEYSGRLDALFIMPGEVQDVPTILATMRARHVTSISSDPDCIERGCCVLMVNAEQRVNIVLNTELAQAVGARFSTVFMMMVKRI